MSSETGIPPVIAPPAAGPRAQSGASEERPWGFWATVGLTTVVASGAVMAQAVVAVIWSLATNAFRAEEAGSNGLVLAMAAWASVPVVLGLSYLFARIRTGPHAAYYLGFRRFQAKALFRWCIALLLLVGISDALTTAIGRPIVPPFMEQAYKTAGFLPLLWLALLVAAPLAEETLFRGFLFEGLLHSKLGVPGAVILSSLVWSAIHVQYDLYGIATIFVSGLLLGYVRFKTGSIYATMFLHGLMNLVATIEAAVLLMIKR